MFVPFAQLKRLCKFFSTPFGGGQGHPQAPPLATPMLLTVAWSRGPDAGMESYIQAAVIWESLKQATFGSSFFFVGKLHRVERCGSEDLMPNFPVSCLPPSPSRVDPKVQEVKVIIDCRQLVPVFNQATLANSAWPSHCGRAVIAVDGYLLGL